MKKTTVIVGLEDHHIQYLQTLDRTRTKALRRAIDYSMKADGYEYVPGRWEKRNTSGQIVKVLGNNSRRK